MASSGKPVFGEIVIRTGMVLGVHLLFGALLFGLVLWLTASNDALKPAVLNGLLDPDAAIDYLTDARSGMLGWLAWSLGIGFASSALFVASAEGQNPRNDHEARSRKGLWFALLLITTISAAVLWATGMRVEDVLRLIESRYYIATGVGFLLVLLAFYLSTALCVKAVMQPSVPMAAPLPSLKRN